MAKKNFINGLDSIFSTEDNADELNIIAKKEKKPSSKKTTTRKKKSSTKDFTADLNSLLQEALQESVEQRAEKKKKKPVAKTKRSTQRGRIKRTLSGLDALIRQTVTSNDIRLMQENDADPAKPKKKRVTFSFDNEKVEKLKSIARLEKSYIKDIVSEIVSEYINEYEKSQGDINN